MSVPSYDHAQLVFLCGCVCPHSLLEDAIAIQSSYFIHEVRKQYESFRLISQIYALRSGDLVVP